MFAHQTEREATRLPPHLKQQILSAIVAHLPVYGRARWDLIRERPDFALYIGKAAGAAGKRKFHRWVASIASPPAADVTRPHEARTAADEALAAATETAREAAKHLPSSPPPAYLMREGAAATRNIDFLAEVHGIYADAVRLRNEAVELDTDAPGGERISDSKYFDRSINRRLDVINAVVRVMQQIWDLESQQRFNQAVFDVIVQELAGHPAIQERVLVKLKELNERHAMTIQGGSL